MIMHAAEGERPGVVIGIHGLANKPPVAEKTRWWASAIREGLVRNEGLADPDFTFRFVYWADLRYDVPLACEDLPDPYRAVPGTDPFPDGGEAPTCTGHDMLATLYAGLERIQEMTGVTPVDDTILEHRFDDLWHYNVTQTFARSVRARLFEELVAHRDRRILLVAHSMGAVIAYDTLRLLERDDPSVRVAQLVTLGAPLGLAKVKLKIEAETGSVRVPNNVARWTNLADGDDIVAVAGTLAADYAPSDAGVAVEDKRVINDYHRLDGTRNHHKSYGYLRTPEFSRLAAGFLGPAGAGPSADPRRPATSRSVQDTVRSRL